MSRGFVTFIKISRNCHTLVTSVMIVTLLSQSHDIKSSWILMGLGFTQMRYSCHKTVTKKVGIHCKSRQFDVSQIDLVVDNNYNTSLFDVQQMIHQIVVIRCFVD